jgi:hypothetical protein
LESDGIYLLLVSAKVVDLLGENINNIKKSLKLRYMLIRNVV